MYDHIGLKVKNLEASLRFYGCALAPLGLVVCSSDETSAGLKAGGKDNGQPGLRTDYSPKYYAAFLVDPDGNNVEAVCLK